MLSKKYTLDYSSYYYIKIIHTCIYLFLHVIQAAANIKAKENHVKNNENA